MFSSIQKFQSQFASRKSNEAGMSLAEAIISIAISVIIMTFTIGITNTTLASTHVFLIRDAVSLNNPLVNDFFYYNPDGVADFRSQGCEGDTKVTPKLNLSVAPTVCLTVTGSAEDYVIRATSVGLKKPYMYEYDRFLNDYQSV